MGETERESDLNVALDSIERMVQNANCRLSEKSRIALQCALRLSKRLGTDVYSEALLYGLSESGSILIPILDSLDIVPASIQEACVESIEHGIRHNEVDPWDPGHVVGGAGVGTTKAVIIDAIEQAAQENRTTIHTSDMISGLVRYSVDTLERDGLPIDPKFTKADLDSESFGSFFHEIIDGAGLTLGQIASEVRRFRYFEPYIEKVQYLLSVEGGEYSLTPFSFFNAYCIEAEEGNDEKLYIAKVNTPTHLPLYYEHELQELNWLINRDDTTEYELQRFFNRYPKFLLALGYKNLHSHVVLESITGDKLIPDFFLERFGSGFGDIVDLKLPNDRLISGPRNRRGFSYKLTMALNQLREYRDFFEDKGNREEFHRKYGLSSYRPRIIVVMGRERHFYDEIERRRIVDQYRHLTIVTYDEILNRARSSGIMLK